MKESQILGPVLALAEVQAAAQHGKIDLKVESAAKPLAEVYGRANAKKKALEGILALTQADYVESVQLGQEKADVYCSMLDGRGWYVKFYLSTEQTDPYDDLIICVSFHPPKKLLKTKDGSRTIAPWKPD